MKEQYRADAGNADRVAVSADRWHSVITRSGTLYRLRVMASGSEFDAIRLLRYSRETQTGPFRAIADAALNAYMRKPAHIELGEPLEIIRAPFADDQQLIRTSPVIDIPPP